MAGLITRERRVHDDTPNRVKHLLITVGKRDREPLEDESSRREVPEHLPEFPGGGFRGCKIAAYHSIARPLLDSGGVGQDLVDPGLYRRIIEQGHEPDSMAHVC